MKPILTIKRISKTVVLMAILFVNTLTAHAATNNPAPTTIPQSTDDLLDYTWRILTRLNELSTNVTATLEGTVTVDSTVHTNGYSATSNLLYQIVTKLNEGLGLTNASQAAVGATNVPGATFAVDASGSAVGLTNLNILIKQFTATNYTGADLVAGDVMFQGVELTGVMRAGKNATLNNVSLDSNTNNAGMVIKLLLTKAPITWPADSSVANIVQSERTNILGTVVMNSTNCEWLVLGTNSTWTHYPLNLGVTGTNGNTSIWAYGVTGVGWTNAGNDTWTLTLTDD